MTSAAGSVALQSTARAANPALRMAAVRAVGDAASLSLAVAAGFVCWSLINPSIPPLHASMGLAIAGCFASLAFHGLYPGVGMTAVQHIRLIVRSINLVYLLLTTSMFLMHDWWANTRGGFFLAWGFSLVLVPLTRWMVAAGLRSASWWGIPVIILGAGRTGRAVIRDLLNTQVLGFRPVLCLDDDPAKHGDCLGVAVPAGLAAAEYYAQALQIRYAIVAIPGMPRVRLVEKLERWSKVFPKIIIVPDLLGVASLWTEPRDLGGVLGLEIRCNLLDPLNQILKRAMDVAVAALALLAAAPVLVVAAVWIKYVSPGAVFYRQEREGKHGKRIRVLKLRTMYPDADRMLERCLAVSLQARAEWGRFCKLRNDPRILPGIGAFLRKSSLDELPQLWNVLRGEMSLVGPRPFPAYHNERFEPNFRRLRIQVMPGLTGLWQVSARSDGDLETQASLDAYYIRNWSLWLDAYILVRTIRTVVAREGAY